MAAEPAAPAQRAATERRIIPISSGKGGVGKTTLAINYALSLSRHGRTVLVETSGEADVSGVDPRVHKIMDLKAPGSGESHRNRWSNLAHLGPRDEVLRLVDVELDKLLGDGITADELEVAIGYLAGAYVLGLEDTGSRMARLGSLLTTTGAIRPVEEQLARWRAVTLDDVDDVMRRVFAQPRSMAVVGPVSEAMVRGRKPRSRSA